jgi:restriction endonuclease S subunit
LYRYNWRKKLTKKLSEVTTLFSGAFCKPTPGGNVCYIQARDIIDNLQISEEITPSLIADRKINKHFLQSGDLLVPAKGREHCAIEYTGNPHPAIASSLFIIIRVQEQASLSTSYLRWFLNLPASQRLIASGAQGSALPVISKSDLGQIVIPIPSVEKQALILKVEELGLKEAAIIKQIENLKRRKLEQELISTIY